MVTALDYGPLIGQLEQDLGVSLDTIARALDVERRTAERWRRSQNGPQGKTRERLRELLALRDQMLAMFGVAETAQEWLHDRSLYLGGLTRVEALNAGRVDRVKADLDGLAGAVYL